MPIPCSHPDASSGNMNTPREWQGCEQAGGWIWLVHAASNGGKLILRKWEAWQVRLHTWLPAFYVCQPSGRMCFLECTLQMRKSVHVPTYACVTHYLYKICALLCMNIRHLDQTFHFCFKFLLEDKRKTLKDKESYKWAGTVIYFEQSTWTTWKPC